MSARVVTTDAPVDLATRLQLTIHAVKVVQICLFRSNRQQQVLSPDMSASESLDVQVVECWCSMNAL